MSDPKSSNQAQEWEKIRAAFMSSIMIDTPLSSLAQNLEGPDWPIKSKDEKPSSYIDLSYDDMCALLAQKGYPNQAEMLISLLRDTLSFDDPFGDMVEHTDQSAERDNQLLKNMAKLQIAEDFPISLTALNGDALEFCRTENMSTLGEFARFAQNMSQNVIVGGDFRKLLNALSHIDEAALSEVLPFRPAATGLHLFECLSQNPEGTDSTQRTAAAFKQFEAEWESIKNELRDGGDLARMLVVLKNPAVEKRVAVQLQPLLEEAGIVTEKKKSGLFGAFSRIFSK